MKERSTFLNLSQIVMHPALTKIIHPTLYKVVIMMMMMIPSITHSESTKKKRRKNVPQPTNCVKLEDNAASGSDKLINDEDALHDPTPSNHQSHFYDERAMTGTVPHSKDSSYTDKNYCFVCKTPQSKIARHLKQHEKEEPEIAEAFLLPTHSKERKRLLEKLRNKGNYQHNQEAMENQSGPLKLKRRPKRSNGSLNDKRYVHCVYCKGMFIRKELWRHIRRCPSKLLTDTEATGRIKVLPLADVAESTFSQAVSHEVWKILANMKQDEVASVARNDFLILQLGQSFYNKHGSNPKKFEYIRQKVREMGRLLLILRKKSIFSFEDAVKPNNFYQVIQAVRDVAGYDEEKHSYRTPSLALKLGHSLKKIGDIILCRAVAGEDEETIKAAERFTKLCRKEWTELVPHTGVATFSKSKLNKPSTIPFTQDVQLFHQYLEKKSADAVENLKKNESPQMYAELARVTLAQTIISNRRCAGEVSKITLESFKKRDQTELHKDVAVSLSPFERKLARHFSRVEFVCKKGRKVAILLNHEVASAATLLADKRDACSVDSDNPFLFGRPQCPPTSFYRGQDCIRNLANQCGARNPEYLRFAHLRKHIATLSQILSLGDNELDQLANFLGHGIRVHRDFYRLPEATIEMAKISKLLLTMEKGSLARFQGKSLDEIELEDELELDLEEDEVDKDDGGGEDGDDGEGGGEDGNDGGGEDGDGDEDDGGGDGEDGESEPVLGLMESQGTKKPEDTSSKGKRKSEDLTEDEVTSSKGKRKKMKLSQDEAKSAKGSKTTEVTSNATANSNSSSAASEQVCIQTNLGDSYVVCSECGKTVQTGQTLYQPENALQVYCSASCFSQNHPNVRLDTRKCHNCFQVITRPHNIIRAPVDDSGTMMELCSDTCLSSVKARMKVTYPRPHPQVRSCKICEMCSRSSLCKQFKLTLDGVVHSLCSESCATSYYQKVNNRPLPRCDMCSCFCLDRRLVVKMEDGCKTVCSDKCLVEFKEKVETRQLCLTCQTFHHLSDMVENQNKEGVLDFFCSNRCMLVFTGPSFTVSETKSLSSDEPDGAEVKPLLPKLKCIKEEPIDEFCIQTVSGSTSPHDIKHEVSVAKVESTEEDEVKTSPVFSLTGDSTPTETSSSTYTGLPASCTRCRKDLMDKDTVYQRKDHTDIFCSTSCLFKFCQAKPFTCNFCLREIMEPKDDLKSAVEDEETKVFCSQPCLSSFNYKEVASARMPIVLLSSHSQCSMCSRHCIGKREIIQQGAVHKICSDQCFFRFCNLNNLSVCENCRSHCDKPLTVKMEGGHKTVCGAECLTQFKQKIQTPQPCAMCRNSKLISDMVENRNSEDVLQFFCTSSCAMASKVQTASGAPLNCDYCDNMTVPKCHLAMTDASIRNFCSLNCAMAFKEKKDNKKDVIAATNGASEQTTFHKPPEKLLCALCKCVIRLTPKVIQTQEKTTFVCSLTCSQEYKIVNNIVGLCEHCKKERIIRDVKRIDDKDCHFCSEGCKKLHRYELEKRWGKACRPCAYCFCISRMVVTTRDELTNKEFCSELCCRSYKKLVSREAKCDACGLEGELKKSLSLLGGVQHFCDLKCLLHFCIKKVQMVDEASSSPPETNDTSGSFPVIVNVVSLAGALAERLRSMEAAAERKKESITDVKTKVVEQKVTKELKNKAVLCTPLVHNKGVSCTAQSLETEKQAECSGRTSPKVVILPVPVPVPVYVPVPMNMYSQYTPKPVGLPLPLPVPMFLSEKTSDSEPTITALEERMNPHGNKREDEHVTKDEEEAHESLTNVDRPTAPLPELPPLDTKSVASPLLQRAVRKDHNKDELQQLPNKSEEETSQRSISQDVAPKMPRKLETKCGVEAWRRWIQSRTNVGSVSSHAVTFKEDILSCSAAELSDGLCLFIHEVKLLDGESYSPDGLFYLCLSIQLYLLDNGRFENIFSDLIYRRFSTEFTNILRHLKPPVTASGYIHSRVEEEFLWDCKQLGAYSPVVLLNTLLFFCCKFFGFTTVEQHRQLSFSHLRLCTRTNQNSTKTTVLRFYRPTSLNETDADGVPAKKRKRNEGEGNFLEMMENAQNPLRCPVRLYKFYLSKCPGSVRQRSDLFYLHPDHRCVPSSPLWFSPAPLDASSMEAMIVRILAVRELQETGEGGRGSRVEQRSE